jgi:glycerate dehydrogenase
MQIVVLDGYTLNPGDLSWAALEALGQCTIYDRLFPEELVSRAAEADIVLTNKLEISRETIDRLPRLKYIGVTATGYNIVDVVAARERGIPVCNVPDYATQSVVQMVFAHLLNLTLHVAEHARGVAEGRWSRSPDFCYWDFPLVELAGLTMGLVGFGRIGRATAQVALAMGMRVLAYDKVIPPGDCPNFRPGDCPNFRLSENGTVPLAPAPLQFVALDDLFHQSDVVSLHCPLTPETRNLVNAERLALMKRSAYLINTSRGPLVDERALAAALHADQIAGAGLDVLCDEPPPVDHPLLTAPNCYITPHIAWATRAARERLLAVAASNVKAFLAGKPQNVVNAGS